jgi:tRNA U34 5-methylaminomethyl-2-thiouridine-forming methyltransferase MnmC
VFLDGNHLPGRWQNTNHFTIGELGFGTGLNFLETWRQWAATRTAGQSLQFTSFEAYPLTADDMERALARWEPLQGLARQLVARWREGPGLPVSWRPDSQTTLTVLRGDAERTVPGWDGTADAWFLDGFSPARNPQMWSADLMREVFLHTSQHGSFATYTAAGWVRRNLLQAGFTVHKREGFGGKREMLFGTRQDASP